MSDPSTYNHEVIEITGFVSHGFEDFGLFDPTCTSDSSVWLEYGGTIKSGTIYCCGATNIRFRPKQLEVESIPVSLVDDQRFPEFDRLIQRTPDSIVHATIVGRFFAGQQIHYPSGSSSWGGYGHMGCCSLLIIQQVLSVDPHDRADLDYRASVDLPENNQVGCGDRTLAPVKPYGDPIEVQKLADSGQHNSAFDDPQRVASDYIGILQKIDGSSIHGMNLKRKRQGEFVFEWKRPGTKVSYFIAVGRPYWLSFYSRDSKRVAWVVVEAYEYSCGYRRTGL